MQNPLPQACRSKIAGVFLLASVWAVSAQAAVVTLPSYGADPNSVTVSGISSGAYMAVQMHVAYSATFKGAAIISGGPYNCAQGSMTTATGYCMTATSASGIPVSTLVSNTRNRSNAGTIDNVSNLSNTQIYLWHGTQDTKIKTGVMDALQQYYGNFTTTGNIRYDNSTAAGHGWISLYASNACSAESGNYINNCNIDVQQIFLGKFYGALNAKNDGSAQGQVIEFNQSEFVPSGKTAAGISVRSAGFAYIPNACNSGSSGCRVHVAFHGCLQDYGNIGMDFVNLAGIRQWADTNRIIVVYPQTVASYSPLNPNACWDWWGYTGSDYDLKSGAQMQMVKKIVDRITSGGSGTTTTTTATTTTTTSAGACYKDNNYNHVAAGRAHQTLGVTYANGSNQNMGLYNMLTTTKLRKTGTNYYVIDNTCP